MRISALAAALVVMLGGVAFAGDYHSGVNLNCQECHVMHGSQQHGYNANGGGTYTALGGAAPYQDLLRNHVNELCLTCHDGSSFAPDVLHANGGTIPTNGRQAGALNEGNVSPYFDADGHTLGSLAAAPGGSFAATGDGLECTNCHQPHGYGGPTANPYRNLSPFSGGGFHASVTYAVGANDLTKDVFERSSGGSNHYDLANVDFNEPTATASGYGAWCKTCHTGFHGSSTDPGMRNQAGAAGTAWLKHPTADVNIGGQSAGGHSVLAVFGGNLYRSQVMSPSGDWGTRGVAWAAAPTDLTPSCFSCHKGHGNKNAFGLIYSTGTAELTEEGNGTSARDQCRRCHVQ